MNDITMSNSPIRNSNGIGVEDIEITLLLEGIYLKYGLDFRQYSFSSLKRRIKKFLSEEKINTISALQEKLFHNTSCMERFFLNLSINTTSLFRDPTFFLTLRNEVIPLLMTYPFIRIWVAGCSTGEEVYSIAIIFKESKLYDRCRIYATDFNENVLIKARDGIYPINLIKEYSTNYINSGGQVSLSEYYTADYGNVVFNADIKSNIVFTRHNLVMDHSFNEFNIILCRNVMIYFNKILHDNVINLFKESLVSFGFLCLGKKESLNLVYNDDFASFNGREKIYRKA